MIQVSLADRVHEVRFLLGKIISPLLEHNSKGSKPVEGAFECVFIDENLAMVIIFLKKRMNGIYV